MPIYPYQGKYPKLGKDCYVAPNASLIGDVELGDGASVWFGAVLRGDVSPIRVGARSNIQDGTVIHCDEGYPTIIGEDVTVGHGAIVHGAVVGDRVLVGMGSVLLSRCRVESDTIIGARALVTEDMEVEGGTLALGMPAQVKRMLTEGETKRILHSAQHYVEHAARYMGATEETNSDDP